MRRGALILVALAGALIAPARADAGVLGYYAPAGVLIYLHHPGVDGDVPHRLIVDRVGDDYRLTDTSGGIFLDETAPCFYRWDDTRAEVRCDAAAALALRAFLGPADDVIAVSGDLPLEACGGAGADTITGGAGSDIIDGGLGPDDLRGGAGDDTFTPLTRLRAESCTPTDAPGAVDRFDGGPGGDHIEGGPGRDFMSGGDGSDRMFGFEGDDRLDGGGDTDVVFGMDGNDEVDGGGGDDFVFGGLGDDRLRGGAGDDLLGLTARTRYAHTGAPEDLRTVAEEGDDILAGGDGDDFLAAGPGVTTFDIENLFAAFGGSIDRGLLTARVNGADQLFGGPGEDWVSYVNRDTPVHASLDGLANDGAAGEGDQIDADVELLSGGAREDLLVASAQGTLLDGDLGDDVLVGGPGPDLLIGGTDEGRDRLAGAGGEDDLRGGPGNDELDGGAARDLLFGGAGDDSVYGRDGVDTVEGGAGADLLDGGAGPDCLAGFGVTSAAPPGGDCRRSPFPTAPVGADGDDVLRGGPARDRLAGGPGADIADYSQLRAPVVVALAGAPAGATAGFGPSADTDDLAPDVESIRGGTGSDTLIGNAADNLLDGGPGHDQLVGAGGGDRLRGGSGGDLLDARDGAIDAVRCGTQRDLALIDEDDEVISGLADACELADTGRGVPGLPMAAPAGACALPVRFPGLVRTFVLSRPASVFWGTRLDASGGCAANVRGAPGSRPGRAWTRLAGAAVELEPRRGGAKLVARLVGGRLTPCGDRVVATRRLDVAGGLIARGRTLRSEAADAAWQVIDGCERTRVQVGRGRVTVSDADGHRTVLRRTR